MNKTDNNNQKWLAAYLYYNEPWEEFLRNAVSVFVDKTIRQNLASQFFFIRYWERGPHIRLRFKGNRISMDKDLRPKAEEYFKEYFKKYPSERKEFKMNDKIPKEQKWFPNNSIQFIEYEPETERYGGPAGLEISEELFQHSSNTVLEILKENDNWNYETSLAAGIQMHLAFAHSFKMTYSQMQKFFLKICKSWDMAVINTSILKNKNEIEKKRSDVWQSFENNFQTQKSMLVEFARFLLDALSSNSIFENRWLNNWIYNLNIICGKLETAEKENLIVAPSWYKYDVSTNIDEQDQKLWSILYSYIHMTNNRLGILNQDEAYLAYLIKRSIESL